MDFKNMDYKRVDDEFGCLNLIPDSQEIFDKECENDFTRTSQMSTHYADLMSQQEIPTRRNDLRGIFNISTKETNPEHDESFTEQCSKFLDGFDCDADDDITSNCVSILNDDSGRMAFYDPFITHLEKDNEYFGKGENLHSSPTVKLTDRQFKLKMKQMDDEFQEKIKNEQKEDALMYETLKTRIDNMYK